MAVTEYLVKLESRDYAGVSWRIPEGGPRSRIQGFCTFSSELTQERKQHFLQNKRSPLEGKIEIILTKMDGLE
jgi:hypothetical protein